jgi:hypothetical protein
MRLVPAVLATLASLPVLAQDFASDARRFEDTIHQMARVDQKHPDFLHTSLDYAQLLARSADEACLERLPKAESLLETVRNSQVVDLVLGTSAARIPFTGYLVEMARHRCEVDPPRRRAALLAAQKLAREAVEGYRAGYHYDAMAVMQFNVAQATRDLGDEPASIRELEAALEMDRVYGLRDDAKDNFRVLREWQGKPASTEELAAFEKGLAPRSVSLKFGWQPFTATAQAQYELTSFEGGIAKVTRLAVPLTGKLSADGDGYLLDWRPGKPVVDMVVEKSAESRIEHAMLSMLARVLGSQVPAKLDREGNFTGTGELAPVVDGLSREIDGAVTTALPPKDERLASVATAMNTVLKPLASADVLGAKTRENYILDTALWVGATLEHGTWMETKQVLSMNGTPNGAVEQRVRVVLSRWLPCAKGRPPESCVELLLDARPLPEAVDAIAKKMIADGQGRLDYAGETRRRVVLDPATLRVHETETMRMGYLAVSKEKQRAVKIGSERTRVTYQYPR